MSLAGPRNTEQSILTQRALSRRGFGGHPETAIPFLTRTETFVENIVCTSLLLSLRINDSLFLMMFV